MLTVYGWLRVGIALLLVGSLERSIAAQPGGSPPRLAFVEINGAKNPELIPQWSAWGFAFRVVAGGSRQLPTSVLEHVSKAEEAFVLAQADLVQRIDADCQQRHSRILAKRGREKLDALDQQVRALALECRGATLETRDRVLAGINPDARVALIAFVESTKAGTSVTVPKARLARFREPE
jgi:hypothetical protein